MGGFAVKATAPVMQMLLKCLMRYGVGKLHNRKAYSDCKPCVKGAAHNKKAAHGIGQARMKLAHQLIASGHVSAGQHLLPVGVLLLQVLPVALLYAAQAAHISFCRTFLLYTNHSMLKPAMLQVTCSASKTAEVL